MKSFTITFFTMLLLVGMVSHNTAIAVNHDIHVGNYSFNPSTLNVDVGDVITWIWDNGSHTTTSTAVPAGASGWDAPLNSANTTFQYTVMVPGNYSYKCTPHAGMGMVGSFTAAGTTLTLTVTPVQSKCHSAAGSANYSVTSNTDWTPSSNQSWCAVSAGGSGDGTITATYDENLTTSQRIAVITVSGTGVSAQTVTLTQQEPLLH